MNDMLEKAALLIEREEKVKALEKELSAAKKEREGANAELAELMLENETQSVNYKGRLLYLATKQAVAYDKEREEDFFASLRENGFADIIRPTVNSRTLTATVTKELMAEDGQGNPVLPEWIREYIHVYEETKVNMRKG